MLVVGQTIPSNSQESFKKTIAINKQLHKS